MDNISQYTTIGSLDDYNAQLDISHDKLYLKSLINSGDLKIIINSTSLINQYYDFILAITSKITLTDKEYVKYRYQPKLYCYEKYGTVELWSLLLKVNNWTSIAEFNSKKIKVFSDEIFNVLNNILVIEESKINKNKESVGY